MTLAEKPPQEMGGQSTRRLRPGAQRSPESCDSNSTNDGRILLCFTMSYYHTLKCSKTSASPEFVSTGISNLNLYFPLETS